MSRSLAPLLRIAQRTVWPQSGSNFSQSSQFGPHRCHMPLVKASSPSPTCQLASSGSLPLSVLHRQGHIDQRLGLGQHQAVQRRDGPLGQALASPVVDCTRTGMAAFS